MNSQTMSNAIEVSIQDKPHFRVVNAIPEGFTKQIENAVRDFIVSSRTPEGVDHSGFYYQTLEAIASATYLNGGGEFWVGTENGRLLIYIIAHISKDIDQRLTYHVSQAWVHPKYRGNLVVKEWWEAIRERAKNLFCGHLVITSTRNPKAYERFLGNGMKKYAVIMKEEL